MHAHKKNGQGSASNEKAKLGHHYTPLQFIFEIIYLNAKNLQVHVLQNNSIRQIDIRASKYACENL